MLSTGIAMEIHFCMGQRAGVDFYHTEDDKCGKCGMKEKKSGCCHDEHQFHKLQDSHKNVFNDISFETADVLVSLDHPLFNWQIPTWELFPVEQQHAPPDYTAPSASVLYCIFRL